jgi:hypothetical protein
MSAIIFVCAPEKRFVPQYCLKGQGDDYGYQAEYDYTAAYQTFMQ